MSFCDLVPPSNIPQERLTELESILSESCGRVRFHLPASGSASAVEFFSSLTRHYRRGVDVRVGATTVPAEDAEKIVAAKDLEGELLSGFSRAIQHCIVHCASRHRRSPDELEGAAYECFLNAMVNYDGSSRFSTLLFTCLHRGLLRFCMGQDELGVPADIRRLTMRVSNAMATERRTFDDAVAALGVGAKQASKVCAAMRTVQNATELKIKQSEMALTTPQEDARWVLEAVKRANLGVLERAAVEAFLEAPAGSHGLTAGCRGLLNPDTGRPYSRAALSCAFKRAREKIARVLGEAA